VSSQLGEGTTFEILFPQVDSTVEVGPEPRAAPPGRKEHILFVDDEEVLTHLAKEMLEKLNYVVTVRTSSIEALQAFRTHPEKYDLVVTDMTMPNMTGDRLACELLNIRSDIPIILCSGFSEKINEQLAKQLGMAAFLKKPVVMGELAGVIRNVLDRK
jgi:CheY-like chemotaxis protein